MVDGEQTQLLVSEDGEKSVCSQQRRRLTILGIAAVFLVGAMRASASRKHLFAQSGIVRMAAAAAEAVVDGGFNVAASRVGPGMTKFLQIAPVITCQLVAVSALKMCQDIKKKGTTTDGEGKPLNPMPFTAMLTNSVVWGLYGLGRRDFTMLTPQILSLISGAYYTGVFHAYTKAGEPAMKTLKQHYFAGGLMSAVTLGLAVFRPFDSPAYPIRSYTMCGQIGVVSSVLLSIGPGATIFRVLATGNTSSMPFYQSLLAFLNNMGWTAYGWFVSRDVLAWGPNLMGLFFTTCQMLAFAMYGVQTIDDQKKGKSGETAQKSGR